MLTEAAAAQILFSEEKQDGKLVATGVKFIHGDKTHVVHARKEIISSAGSAALSYFSFSEVLIPNV